VAKSKSSSLCLSPSAAATLTFAGVYLGQAVAALAGVLAISGECGTGMISVTLAAMPRRGRLLVAKTLVLAGPVRAASALAAAARLLAGAVILPGHGFTADHGFDLLGPAMWRAASCAAVYLTLVALLSLGVTTTVRDPAAATRACSRSSVWSSATTCGAASNRSARCPRASSAWPRGPACSSLPGRAWEW
jgi:ABC-2 type transport system permease protein